MEGLEPVDVLLHCVNILVLFVLLRLILWRPMTKYLEARAGRVKEELDDAARTKSEAEEMRAEYEKSISDLEERGREIMRDSQIRAGAQATEITDAAKGQAEKMLSDAKERIDAERQDAVNAARHDIAQLATEMASRILRREVSLDDNISAARDFFEE
ncbi:MAG: F0F1 ATP synthase subunit B [Oscillospiraceae bacterium]|jgi:F-type H+-transporting ATPase subunit b|nr:F0F1 ATP synthase subunit B [Oscillospiraceae bacterium]